MQVKQTAEMPTTALSMGGKTKPLENSCRFKGNRRRGDAEYELYIKGKLAKLTKRNSIDDEYAVEYGNCLGMGTYGKVYKAVNRDTGETVAVKAIDLEIYEAEVFRVVNELTILTRLNPKIEESHPHIVKYYESFWDEQEDYLYVVMEYLNGNLIDAWKDLGRINIPVEILAIIAKQVLLGLDYAHEKKVIHRDLKQENIMFDSVGNLKLVDFGLGLYRKHGGYSNSTIGTLGFMSPEVQLSLAYDDRADSYSLGAIIFELALDRKFTISAGQSTEEVLDASGLDHGTDLYEFLRNCLQYDPRNRMRTPQLLNSPFVRSADELEGLGGSRRWRHGLRWAGGRGNNINAASAAVEKATTNGCIEVLKLLLADPRIKFDAVNVLREAVLGGHKKIVQLLLTDERISPADSNSLRLAVEKKQMEVARILVKDGRCSTEGVAVEAARKGHLELFPLLFPQERTDFGECLKAAIEGGQDEILKIILSDERSKRQTEALESALIQAIGDKKNTSTLRIFLENVSFDRFKYTSVFKLAAFDGNIEAVKILLADERADPTANDYSGLIYAWGNRRDIRYLKTACLILADKRVNLAHVVPQLVISRDHPFKHCRDGDLESFQQYIEAHRQTFLDQPVEILQVLIKRNSQHQEIQKFIREILLSGFGFDRLSELEVLLKCLQPDSKDHIDLGEYASAAVEKATANGCSEVLKLLLADPKVNFDGANILQDAVLEGHKDIVQLLLTDERIHPESSDVLRFAVLYGRLEIARLLVEDGRCPTDGVAERAASKGYIELFLLLFPQERTNFGECLKAAVQFGREEILKIILSDDRAKNQTEALESALITAVSDKKSTSTLRIFLENVSFDRFKYTSVFKLAAVDGNNEAVKILLADERADPTANDYSELINAWGNCHEPRYLETACLILADKRVNLAHVVPQLVISRDHPFKHCRDGDLESFQQFIEAHRQTFLDQPVEILQVLIKRNSQHQEIQKFIREILLSGFGFDKLTELEVLLKCLQPDPKDHINLGEYFGKN